MHHFLLHSWLVLLLLVCTGCAPAAQPLIGPPTPTRSPSLTPAPSPSPTLAPPNVSNSVPVGLTIDEIALKGEVSTEPLTFKPVQGTQEEVLARHSQVWRAPYQRIFDYVDNHTTIYPVTGEKTYRALQIEQQSGAVHEILVQMQKDEQPILTVKAGPVTPITTLAGLWVENSGAWVLEIASTANTSQDNGIPLSAAGQLYRNGTLLNQAYGYPEMFGYQLLDGKPFYFYKQAGQIHLSYDNQALPLVYEDVPHYNCCSAAALNPIAAPNGVRFFGLRAGVWYYTEIGKY